jgi:outer membrane receptor protein involved in Fe transport
MMNKMVWLGASCLAGSALAAMPALAADKAAADAEISASSIVVTAPLASDTTTLSQVPANAQVLSGDPLTRQNHANLADLLNANLGSISLSNGTGSPYQSDVSYRGFQATSLLARPPACRSISTVCG